MTDITCAHFGFTQPPFTKEISDTDLWLPASKQAVVDDLVECLEARQCALLSGEPGVGKTYPSHGSRVDFTAS